MGSRDIPTSRVSTPESRDGHDRIFGDHKKGSGRTKYIQVDGKLVADNGQTLEQKSAYIMGDMTPYKSPLDGSIITGRAMHRAHKREHGVIEVGNEKLTRGMRKPFDEKKARAEIHQEIKDARNR